MSKRESSLPRSELPSSNHTSDPERWIPPPKPPCAYPVDVLDSRIAADENADLTDDDPPFEDGAAILTDTTKRV
jgi:hypothetical protein